MEIVCTKIGSGTMEDPYRPDLTSDPKIRQLFDLLDLKRQAGKEIRDQTFFRMRVIEDRGTDYLVEIVEGEKTIDDWIVELSS